ncbi:uncharacterized protein LOC131847470 isoform X2 [Achroia grisella]|uniref:uncharacterized protein LOC131847470 isoform X2 n=1 Tax=Achroia grisella TaxID=688607 RepID=UPI0027D27B60|nr:uncharacterized protein LOC131847470 isoform X2 [Achroia grisella]
MKENKRKCLKCGSSPADNPETVLFRFPKPGSTNVTRCELWAKYCCPDKQWSSVSFQSKLYSEHRMLCHRHFKESAFVDFASKKLRRFASPDVELVTLPFLSVNMDTRAGPSDITNTCMSREIFTESSNVSGPSNIQGPLVLPGTSNASTGGVRKNEDRAYMKCKQYMRKICQLKKKIKCMNNNKYLQKFNSDEGIRKLANKISPTFSLMLHAQLKNFKKHAKGRRWTTEDKIIALRLYKRSPTCYRLLRRMFCLPAPTTLKVLLSKCSMNVGINQQLFEIINKYISKQEPEVNEYVLMFDEMSIKKHLY